MDLSDSGHFGRSTAIEPLLRSSVEGGDAVGEPIQYVPIEATRLGKRVEQQVLIEPPHHDDPIESLAVRRKADGACGAAEEAANLLVKRWRGAPVQYQFGFAGAPSQIRGRKVEIGIRYCPLQLEDAIACDKDQ